MFPLKLIQLLCAPICTKVRRQIQMRQTAKGIDKFGHEQNCCVVPAVKLPSYQSFIFFCLLDSNWAERTQATFQTTACLCHFFTETRCRMWLQFVNRCLWTILMAALCHDLLHENSTYRSVESKGKKWIENNFTTSMFYLEEDEMNLEQFEVHNYFNSVPCWRQKIERNKFIALSHTTLWPRSNVRKGSHLSEKVLRSRNISLYQVICTPWLRCTSVRSKLPGLNDKFSWCVYNVFYDDVLAMCFLRILKVRNHEGWIGHLNRFKPNLSSRTPEHREPENQRFSKNRSLDKCQFGRKGLTWDWFPAKTDVSFSCLILENKSVGTFEDD